MQLLTRGIGVPSAGLRFVLRGKPMVEVRFTAPAGTQLPSELQSFLWVGGMPMDEDAVRGASVRWILAEERSRIGIRAEGLALWERDVDVPAGEVLDLGEIALDAGRDVAGQVVDGTGRPVPGAQVETEHRFGPEAETDSNGKFVLRHASRTSFPVFAEADGYVRGGAIAEPAGAGERLRIELPRGGLVRITVRAANGGPGIAYSVHVDASGQLAEPNYAWLQSDENGQCQARLSPGSYRISVLRGVDSEVSLAREDVTLVEGAETAVEVRLP